MQTHSLAGGFSAPAEDAAHAFRSVMNAMAKPGTLQPVGGATPPVPLSAAAGVVLLTLADPETPVYLAGASDCQAVRDWVAFHTGAALSTAEECVFAVGDWPSLAPLSRYPIGTAEYPDRSATLIVELDSLSASGAVLTGPGIREHTALSLPETAAFQSNALHFPCGIDFIFTCGDQVAALPRSTQVS